MGSDSDSVKSVKKSKTSIRPPSSSSSSSSDNEPEPDENNKAKSGFANPLFMLNKEGGKSDEDVKQVLVERLFSLLSNEENKEKQEMKHSSTDEVEKVEKEKPLPLLYANNKESVDVKRIAELRPFADLLMIEMCTGSLAFLGNYRITLKELENIVHKAISKLETPRPLSKSKDLGKSRQH